MDFAQEMPITSDTKALNLGGGCLFLSPFVYNKLDKIEEHAYFSGRLKNEFIQMTVAEVYKC